jgi:TrmH family RNA methyltransferase
MISKNEIKRIRGLKAKKQRDKLNVFIAEGYKLVKHLLDYGIQAEGLYYLNEFKGELPQEAQPILPVEMKQISLLDSPSSVLGVFTKPNPERIKGDFVLALDDVRDPGNLGTLIRLADWFGVDTILCSRNCVDLYNPKVVQSTMGSLANVNVVSSELEKDLEFLKKDGFEVCGTFMNGEALNSIEKPAKCVLVLGNEANGISESVESYSDRKITIAKAKNASAESLNVAMAGAIILGKWM